MFAKVRGQYRRALQNINPTVVELRKSFEDLTQGMVACLLSRKPAAKLPRAAKSRRTAVESGIRQSASWRSRKANVSGP